MPDNSLVSSDPMTSPVTPPLPGKLPLPAEGPGSLAFWHAEIKAAAEVKDKYLDKWKTNLKRYKGDKQSFPQWDDTDVVQVNVDYFKTEQKKSQLFFRTPDVVLTPRRPEFAAATPIFQAVINYYLGDEEADSLTAVDEVLTDVLCPAGIGWVKVGYSGLAAGTMDEAGVPIPVVTGEEYYIERGSPAKLLIPADFTGSNYDKADWLGFASYLSAQELATLGAGIRPAKPASPERDQDQLADSLRSRSRSDLHRVTEIWYRAWRFDPNIKSKILVRRLILVDDEEQIRHEDSPYQRFDPMGKFVAGMRGFPIKILTLRYTPDDHYPASDCQMSRPTVDELTHTRTIQMQQKRRALPMRAVDRNRVTSEDILRVQQGKVQSIILTDGPPNEIWSVLALPTLPRDTTVASDLSTQDINQIWALGQNQSTVSEQGSKTATELQLIQGGTDVRLDKERHRVLRWYISIAQALGGLLQLFADEQQYVEIAGPEASTRLQAWNRETIAGQFVYKIKPDSAQRLDVNVERKMALDFYQLTANDPNVNRQEVLRDLIVKWQYDPTRIMQQPPPPPPEKPRINLSFKAEDLINPLVVSLLQQSGYQIDPNALQTTLALQTAHPEVMSGAITRPAPLQPNGPGRPFAEHGGSAQLQEPLNQHSLDHAIGGGR